LKDCPTALTQFSLASMTAVVTGAGGGIGRALAMALAEAGADVAIADLAGDTAADAADAVARVGRRCMVIPTDVTRAEAADEMVSQIVDAWGRLDIAVHSAGVARVTAVEEICESEWDAILDVNLKGMFLCCRAAGRAMLSQGHGSIINVVSMSSHIVNRPQCHAHYNASKAGAMALTRSCAAEWAAKGVRVNALSPGHTHTPMTENQDDATRSTWIANTPMGRIGTPADLTGAAIFLASPASAYVTGHELVVDGGYTLW